MWQAWHFSLQRSLRVPRAFIHPSHPHSLIAFKPMNETRSASPSFLTEPYLPCRNDSGVQGGPGAAVPSRPAGTEREAQPRPPPAPALFCWAPDAPARLGCEEHVSPGKGSNSGLLASGAESAAHGPGNGLLMCQVRPRLPLPEASSRSFAPSSGQRPYKGITGIQVLLS